MYSELMLLWFHLVFNLNTKHDIITKALTSIVGNFKTGNGVCARAAYALSLSALLRPCGHYFDHRSHAQCNSSISLYSACVLRHVCFENNHYPKPQP